VDRPFSDHGVHTLREFVFSKLLLSWSRGWVGRFGYGALIFILMINPIVNDLPSALLFAKLSKAFTFQRRFLEISVVGVNLPNPKSLGYSEM
jgi:hypothetical protein